MHKNCIKQHINQQQEQKKTLARTVNQLILKSSALHPAQSVYRIYA